MTGGKPIFWSDGLSASGSSTWETVEEYSEGEVQVRVGRSLGESVGQGRFKLDFLLYTLAGVDLSRCSSATLETLRLPPRVLLPMFVLVVLSFVTPRNSKSALDRYYAKMKTEVHPDPEQDARQLSEAYDNPQMHNARLLFPGTDLEFVRPRPKDVIGFLASCGVCGIVIGLLVWLAQIGS